MIRVGIGGWVFAPWRGTFYPQGLPHARELEFASRKLTSIEINATFYTTPKPQSFRRWADETPDDFVFSVKAPRYASQRRVLGEAGSSIERFFASGVLELKRKLGPILWQLHPAKKFDQADFSAFAALLPREVDGTALRHVVEVQHRTFLDPAFIAVLRKLGIAVALVDSDKHPLIADLTGDFAYLRLQRSSAAQPTGYPSPDLTLWAKRARKLAQGGRPEDLPTIAPVPSQRSARDVFVYMISGDKVRAPAAALALMERLQ